ncbi:NAD(P)H-dependent oxidoreductase [Catenuloplanes sp. NPDC051500]|uniref:NAD(P)H-dependent oxidoreductase n=1 Tax=Catenuloplanes sp. NPDC051500 TaxID=3363959 RepID=UPI003799D7CD
MSHVHVVYAHPAPQSFTREVLGAFLGGLAEAGHTASVSDLYAQGFRAGLSAEEYARETGRGAHVPVAPDVTVEQERLAAADVWAFVYPVWWNDCPALLKGWFDRVWTAGWAYEPMTLRPARSALVLCTSGHGAADLEASGCYPAMRTTMLADRIGARAAHADFVLFGGQLNGGEAGRREHLRRAAALGREV